MSTDLPKPLILPQQLVMHFSEELAYVNYQYPWRPGKNTTARFWIETRRSFGQRVMYRTYNPEKKVWNKAHPLRDEKTGIPLPYKDIAILTLGKEPTSPECGQIIPIVLNLSDLNLPTLQLFSTYYSFTPYQREIVLEDLQRSGIQSNPGWKTEPYINVALANFYENPQDRFQAEAEKLKIDGILMTSAHDLEKEFKRDRRKRYKANREARESIPIQQSTQQSAKTTREYPNQLRALLARISSTMKLESFIAEHEIQDYSDDQIAMYIDNMIVKDN